MCDFDRKSFSKVHIIHLAFTTYFRFLSENKLSRIVSGTFRGLGNLTML